MYMNPKEGIKLADNAIARLMEHVDHVQILMSWQEKGETVFVSHGAGNWFARTGQAARWLQDCKDDILAGTIAEHLNCEDDSDDDWKQEEKVDA
jgi:hypothetical protein